MCRSVVHNTCTGFPRAPGVRWIDFTFDAADRPTGVADPDGAYTLAYDNASRVTSVQEPFSLILTMGYDADNNQSSVHDSKDGRTTTTYDALGRVSNRKVTASGGTLRFDYAYTAAGRARSPCGGASGRGSTS